MADEQESARKLAQAARDSGEKANPELLGAVLREIRPSAPRSRIVML
jgi:hypothetical protein